MSVIDIPPQTTNELKKKVIINSNLIMVIKDMNEYNKNESIENEDDILIKNSNIPIIFCNKNCLEEQKNNNIDLNSNKIEFKLKRINTNMFKSNHFTSIQKQIHQYITLNLKNSDKKIFSNFFENSELIKDLDTLIEKFKKNTDQILFINKLHGEYLKANNNNEEKEAKNLKNQLVDAKLNKNLELLMKLLVHHPQNVIKILDRFTNLLLEFKNSKTKNMIKLYDFNKKIDEINNGRSSDFNGVIREFTNYWEIIKKESSYFSNLKFFGNENPKDFQKFYFKGN